MAGLMRRSLALLLAAIIMGFACIAVLPAWAEAASDEELRTRITFRSWISRYERTVGDDKLSDTTVMLGPILNLSYDRTFFTGSYMFSTSDYEFDLSGGTVIGARKTDLDLSVGYWLTDIFNAHVGWTRSKLDLEYISGGTGSGDITTSGPTAGVGAQVPLTDDGKTVFTADLTLMRLSTDAELPGGVKGSSDSNAIAAEAGVSTQIVKRLYLNVGYSHRVYYEEEGDDAVISGVYFTLGYAIL